MPVKMTSAPRTPRTTLAASRQSEAKRRLVRNARAFWEPRVGRSLSDDEAREIATNMVGFFDLLLKWSREDELRDAGG